MEGALQAVDRARFLVWGNRVLLAALAGGLLILLYTAAVEPDALPYLAIACIALPAAVYVFSRPRLNLLLVLCSFVLITDYEEGIQIGEVLYGLYFVGYMAFWFIRTVVMERQQIISNHADRALLLFLFWCALATSWGIILGASVRDIAGEANILMMLAMYFPIRHACKNEKGAYLILLGALFWLALFTGARNLLYYRSALSDAAQLWQIATGRVALNEALVMFPALAALVLLLYARQWWLRGALLGILTLSVAALIATQSRGYWVAFLLGIMILLVLTERRRKKYLLGFGAGAGVSFLLLALLLFPDVLELVVAGIASRFLTLGDAITSDISLVNRFYESRALLDEIIKNPVLGHGMGTPFRFFDIISDSTRQDAYTHNVFVGTTFKFGLVGLGLIFFFWLNTIVRGLKLFRNADASAPLRLTGLIAVVCLGAELLVANTSNPFLIADASLLIAMVAGAVHGGWDRLSNPRLMADARRN